MKKVLTILITFFLTLDISFAQKEDNFFYFYIPDQSEIGPFFRLNDYLRKFYPNSKKEADDFLTQVLSIGVENDLMMQTNMILFHIRNTSNPSVRKSFENFCNNNRNIPEIYNLIKQELENATFYNNGILLRNIPDGNRINYGSLIFVSLLNNRINTLIPEGREWKRIKESKDNCVFEIEINGEKLNIEYSVIDETEKQYEYRIDKIKKRRNKNASIIEIPIEGFLKETNAKKIFFTFDHENQKNKNFNIKSYLYSEKYHQTFIVNWNYTLEEKSVLYNSPINIVSYLSEILLFNWID